MTPKTINRPRNVRTDTIVDGSTADARIAYARLTPREQPAPAAQSPAEEEAEHWVTQMMFERYNNNLKSKI